MATKKQSRTVVISDDSLNEYGFRCLTEGCDLSDYVNNPILLFMHYRATGGTIDQILPIGTIDNPRIEDGKVIGDLVFDQTDDFAKKIEAKWDEGTYRMVSAGVKMVDWSDDEANMIAGQSLPTVTKWKLKETSIADIGANANSLAMYDQDDVLVKLSDLNKKEIKTFFSKQTIDMKISKDALAKLGLPENATETEINAAILKSTSAGSADVTLADQLHQANEKIKTLEKEHRAKEIKLMLDKAIADKKFPAGQREKYERLASADYEGTEALLADMPAYKPAAAQVAQHNNTGAEDRTTWNLGDWRNKDPKALAKMEKDEPARFKQLIDAFSQAV